MKMKGFLPKLVAVPGKPYSPKECAELIIKAKESIKIIVPDFNVDFVYNRLILDALKRAVDKGVSVQVAISPLSPENIGILRVPGVQVFPLKRKAERLLMVVDAKHVLVERVPKEPRHIDVGIIVSSAGMLAHEIDNKFDEVIQR